MKRVALAILMAGAAAAAMPASAQDIPQIVRPSQPAEQAKVPTVRYRFERVAENFLRFDNVTGQITFCSQQGANWACQAVPENRPALEKDIGRLQQEVVDLKQQLQGEIGELKQQIVALQPPPPPRPPAPIPPSEASPQASGSGVTIVMPTQEDLDHAKDRAAAFITSAWRRAVDMIVSFQKEAMRRG